MAFGTSSKSGGMPLLSSLPRTLNAPPERLRRHLHVVVAIVGAVCPADVVEDEDVHDLARAVVPAIGRGSRSLGDISVFIEGAQEVGAGQVPVVERAIDHDVGVDHLVDVRGDARVPVGHRKREYARPEHQQRAPGAALTASVIHRSLVIERPPCASRCRARNRTSGRSVLALTTPPGRLVVGWRRRSCGTAAAWTSPARDSGRRPVIRTPSSVKRSVTSPAERARARSSARGYGTTASTGTRRPRSAIAIRSRSASSPSPVSALT